MVNLERRIIKNLPNWLSFLRLGLSGVFLYFIYHSMPIMAMCTVITAGVTDFLDGFIARKFKAESEIGKMADPLADKIFINIALWGIYFMVTNKVFCLAVILSVRDIVLIAGAILCKLNNEKFKRKYFDISPILMSKVCTTLLFLVCIFLIFTQHMIVIICANLLAIAVVIVGLAYLYRIFVTAYDEF